MGSLAKPSQYWIKKQSEGSQSGSKNIVSFNFAFSLRGSLSIFTITRRFLFLTSNTRAARACFIPPFLLAFILYSTLKRAIMSYYYFYFYHYYYF